MSFPIVPIDEIEVGLQGPPASGLTASEKGDILADILALEADVLALQGDVSTAQSDITAVEGDIADLSALWLSFSFDGGGSTLSAGARQFRKIPYNCTITVDPLSGHIWQATIDPAGAISFDVWMDTYANFPPTSGDRICGTLRSNNPRVTATNVRNGGSNTSGWTLNLVGGSYLWVSIASVTSATFADMGLYVVRT